MPRTRNQRIPHDLMTIYPHLGKYEGEPWLTVILDEQMGDEELGDVERFGYFRFYDLDDWDRREGLIGKYKAAILETTSQGFVSGHYYLTLKAALRDWRELENEREGQGGD